MAKKIKILSGMLLVFIYIIFGTVIPLHSEESGGSEPFIVVSSYEITDNIVIPGNAFDLTIEVENTDKSRATRGSVMTISFPDGIRTAYGSSNQLYLDSLKPGEKRKVVFGLYAAPNYSKASVPFEITITSEVRSNSTNIYAPVLLDNSSFKVVSQTVPEEAGAGNKIAASFSFKSLLNEKLSNVVLSVYVDKNKEPITSAMIGNITAGASKTQNLTFFINEKGSHALRFELSYNTADGEASLAELYSGNIQINEPSGDSFYEIDDIQNKPISDSDKLIIIGCLTLSVLLSIGIVIIAKKYN